MSKSELTAGLQDSVQSGHDSQPLYLQLANMYAPSWGYGGPVKMLFDYAKSMTGDCRAIALTSDIHHDFTRISSKTEVMDGVSIYRHKVFFPKLARKSVYLISPSMLWRAWRLISKSPGTTVVHFSELRGLVSLYAMALKLWFGKRVKLVHSAFGSLHFKSGSRRRYYDALFMKAFLKLLDVRMAQNDHELGAYREMAFRHRIHTEQPVTIFPLHVDDSGRQKVRFNDCVKNPTLKSTLRVEHSVPPDALVFVFLGRLHPEKGILRMIDAYREFTHTSARESRLLIIGRDDGFQTEVENYITEKRMQGQVHVINNVYQTRFDYYFLADIFLGFPTIFEETMLASLEALSCGTPILVSREADVPFVEAEQAGMVIDFDVNAAARNMTLLANNLPQMIPNALRVVSSHFDGQAAGSALKRLLLDIGRSPEPVDDGQIPSLNHRDAEVVQS